MKKALLILVLLLVPGVVLAESAPGIWLPRVEMVRKAPPVTQKEGCVGGQCSSPVKSKPIVGQARALRVKWFGGRLWSR